MRARWDVRLTEKIVRRCNSVNIAGEMQVELLSRKH